MHYNYIVEVTGGKKITNLFQLRANRVSLQWLYKRVPIFSQNIPLNSSTTGKQRCVLKMNKLIFLTGLITALLFIGTAHGRQFDRQAFELDELQALMQDSNAVMEIEYEDEDEDEIAKAQFLKVVLSAVKTVGCIAAKAYCKYESIMDNTAIKQGKVRDFVGKVKRVLSKYVTKKNFCAATKFLCSLG